MGITNAEGKDDAISPVKILEAARVQIRRFGESKTNIVDIARALGTSHTTIYRHFKSKADVFDALVLSTMTHEQLLVSAYCNDDSPAAIRLTEFVAALNHFKVRRYAEDPEIFTLYKRVVTERPDIVISYTHRMTGLIQQIIQQGINSGEFKIENAEIAASVVRDAVTIFVHPALVAEAARAGLNMERPLQHVMKTLIIAFNKGLTY